MTSRRITPGARARRALLADTLLALVLALVVLQVTAGLGVVAFICLPLLLVGLLWIGVERLVARIRLRRRPAG
ncbi:MAG TPA: hypothetical protein VKG03_04640 [Solirubrobacterales bacterium]|nr:hypothetical protein [Solirubrobacterales bacterium]